MVKLAKKMKICLAASSGGHLSQLLKLSQSWQGYETFCVTTAEIMRTKLQQYGRVYVVGESNRKHPILLIKVLLKCINIVLRERPDVIISTGAAGGCIMCFLGRLISAKIIWIDSIANTEQLSMSGRMIRPFSNLILTQWPQVAQKYKNVEYVGELI